MTGQKGRPTPADGANFVKAFAAPERHRLGYSSAMPITKLIASSVA